MTYLTSIYILARVKKFVEIGLTKMHIPFLLIKGLRDHSKIGKPGIFELDEVKQIKIFGIISNADSVFYIYSGLGESLFFGFRNLSF